MDLEKLIGGIKEGLIDMLEDENFEMFASEAGLDLVFDGKDKFSIIVKKKEGEK